ncbi:MAG TPA: cupin domain-containing protein [Cyanobacteria bacterium UBA11149]|nr:cupin domain-containing protein [Cyanobacteria bacterium UBA11367]HBE59898.1 cupin domain-containing protein [Cyanobacteria bacterium UBA11366]HBK63903.1 cupin domain-containing protein [Cyanobacteria bacterium UBA11166]HBR75854.1 cupin domain-containing protein [Cyanobacteria bacterium UBA11159]HBS69276.1 cupin domain-containing protein [Cyanobacteria bacterium UBA11153]HBW90447.1 cupin domain-containing protein [Cyanobacteria bacterium UBA11149]HCA96631.1 cupin domain-containing protein 
MIGKPAGILQKPGQGLSYWLLGDLYTYKIVGQDTNQAYALCEIIMKPQSEVPPHIHSHEAEAFYIQEGEMEFQLGEKIIVATPGTFLHSPQGELHRFKNIGSKPAKFLSWVTPAGFENFIREAGVPASEIEDKIPEVTSEDIEKVMATASKYGIKII